MGLWRETGISGRLSVSSQTEGGEGHSGQRALHKQRPRARNRSWQQARGRQLSQQPAQALPTWGCRLQTLARGDGFPLHPCVAFKPSDFLWVGGRGAVTAKRLREERSASDR